MFGTENEHLQIRCRLVIDMTMNLSLYTDNDYLMRNASHVHKRCSNIASYYCIYSGVKHIGNRDQTKEGIESVFKDDIPENSETSQILRAMAISFGCKCLKL